MQSSNEKTSNLLRFLLIIVFVNHVFCDENGTGSNLNVTVSISPHHPLPVDTSSKIPSPLPVETSFKFPSPLPVIPPGGEKNFGKGKIDLGGLEVIQVSISESTSQRVWRAFEGGPDNMGVSIFEPINLPAGFFTLGFYAQPNNRMLFGWVLVAKDISGNSLRPPVDYMELGNTTSLVVKQDGPAYFWQPLCPNGYVAVGVLVTTSPVKPSLRQESISCVRSDHTEQMSEADAWVWGIEGVTVSSLRPANRGTEAAGVFTGTFSFQQLNFPLPSLSCLRNTKFDLSNMPSQDHTRQLFRSYSPLVYFHPNEEFLPSSVDWAFSNGALLYQKGNESNPIPVQPNGSNLPQGGSDDGLYWLDYPADESARERVKRGDLGNTKVYLHIKPMFGGTFTDIVIWIFFPFNGNAHLKILFMKSLSLGNVGEHIGDWEHITLRISNFNGELWRVYFSEHSGGSLVEACDLEFQGGNKPVAYSSLHGHAMFSRPGLVLQGQDGNGIRNDMARSDKFFDTSTGYEVIAGQGIVEPQWLNYFRKWGPTVQHDLEKTIDGIAKTLPGFLRKKFRQLTDKIPHEVLEEEGPTGPKVKQSWNADE